MEPELEKHFHPDSYGYRPGRSAHQALAVAESRCWHHDWIVEFDIKGYFDNIDHDFLMRAVRRHTQEKWVLLYIERWLRDRCRCRTAVSSSETAARRKALSSVRCWPTPIHFCTTPLTTSPRCTPRYAILSANLCCGRLVGTLGVWLIAPADRADDRSLRLVRLAYVARPESPSFAWNCFGPNALSVSAKSTCSVGA
ncbi:reverse transcriptase domain-containing protein [Thauera sp. SDU_THAU2]|uniref:reverse transcriptase domain-containing protein n=1 Tax=Thauera sp. SDU_THAU2 TaxID=3136633 RepID=UPI00311E5CA9